MAKESVVGIFEKIIAPFHNMSIVITAFSALSIHTLLTQLFEPLTHVYYTLLLTFPLTVGLIIVFLILYNTNWKKTSFIYVVLSPIPIALLFMLLTSISDRYGLEKEGLKKHQEEEKLKGGHEEENNSTAAANHIQTTINGGQYDPAAIQKRLNEMVAEDSIARYEAAHPAWYQKIQLTRNLVGAIVFLKEHFIKMYRNYGPTRFISGVLLALLLSWYIQSRGINKLMAVDQQVGNKKTGI